MFEEPHLILTQCTPVQPLDNGEIMDVLKQDSPTATPNQWRGLAVRQNHQPSAPAMLAMEPACPFPRLPSAQQGKRPPGLAGLFGTCRDFGFNVWACIADRRGAISQQVETGGFQGAAPSLITCFFYRTASA
jgi:hypothetical protein